MIHDKIVIYTINSPTSYNPDYNESFITHPKNYKSRIKAKINRKLYYNKNVNLESTISYNNDFVNVEIIGYEYYPSYKIKIKDERGFELTLDGYYFNTKTIPNISLNGGKIMEKLRYYIDNKQIYLTTE